jgi:hypothetical protein
MDGKYIILLSERYNGSPLMCWKYDVLIGSKNVIERFEKELFLPKNLREDWNPKVIKL